VKLAELSRASGVPTASIKYWIREGILIPGAKRNATTAVYDSRHLERLELIGVLRGELNVPIDRIRGLTDLIDNPDTDPLDILERCQVLAMGLTHPPRRGHTTAAVSQVCDAAGWPHTPSWAAEELAAVLRDCSDAGVEVSIEGLESYARLFDTLATSNVAGAVTGSTRDQQAILVLRGVALTQRLERAMSALAHASATITRTR